GETNALQALAYLAGWVNVNIKWNAKGSMNQTPLETMTSMRGDCSEHADLFASLARSVGFPTRHCLGLQLRPEGAIYHNWVEVNVGGAWIPIDTTVNRVGLPAGYILTARDETGENDLSDSLPWAMRSKKLGLHVMEMVKDKNIMIPGNKKTYVAARGDWLANFYWGFAMTKPANWTGRITLSGVDLTTPDGVRTPESSFTFGTATFKCRAENQVYRASEGELASLQRSFKNNMDAYQQKEAKLIPFLDGAALFFDFTCEVKGTVLRSQQYIVPRSGRSYRLTCWAPAESFADYEATFKEIIASIEL
ncbi:MAG: transglutaminase domain-containing protein, partial [Planctomycetes bacterium]|nr:transglutaminase domain-containing protein [Planctomycetota bacterium]